MAMSSKLPIIIPRGNQRRFSSEHEIIRTTRPSSPLDVGIGTPLRYSQSMRLRKNSDHYNYCNSSQSSSTSTVTNRTTSPFINSYNLNRLIDIELKVSHKKNFKTTAITESSTDLNTVVPNGSVSHGTSTSNNCIQQHNLVSPTSNLPTTSQQSILSKREHGMTLNLNSGSGQNSAKVSPQTPRTPLSSKTSIPVQTKHTPKTPPGTPDFSNGYIDDDLDSLHSFTSMASGRSGISCDHPHVARNGTTFSGRKMKYVVHCSSYAGQTGEDYLTPTQRAQRHIRRLKELLSQARVDLEQKDSEILRLTKEVVELRLFKASLASPEDRSNSSDAVTVRENELQTSNDISPIIDMTTDGIKSSPRHHLHHHHGINHVQFIEKMTTSEMQSSFADSGHFEDITTSSVHSKDSFVQTQDTGSGRDETDGDNQELITMYEKRIEDLIKTRDDEKQELKQTHNDRVEALLQKLAECNTRYADLVPDYEAAKERIRELERQLEALQMKLEEQEDKANKMYLHMYAKGQEAERIQHADRVLEFAHQAPNRVSVPELIEQLQVTQDELENIRDTSYQPERSTSQALLSAKEAISLWLLGARKLRDHEYCLSSRTLFERQQTMYKRLVDAQETKNKIDPEITLQFLKSAVYYFLTDKENSQGHLNAIESILGFSELEKIKISQARANK